MDGDSESVERGSMNKDEAAELYALRCETEPCAIDSSGRWHGYQERTECFAEQLDAAIRHADSKHRLPSHPWVGLTKTAAP